MKTIVIQTEMIVLTQNVALFLTPTTCYTNEDHQKALFKAYFLKSYKKLY